MFSSERRLIIFIAVSCFILALLGYAWKQRTVIPYVTVPLQKIMTPFAYGTARAADTLRTGITIIDQSISRHNEIQELQEQNAEIRQGQADYNEVVAENIRLRQLLQFETAHPQFDVAAARIITRDFGTWTNTMIIDRGRAEGIETDMAVVAPGGVVGFVSDVFDHSARVQAMLDPRTSIGVIVQRPESRVTAIVKGNGNYADEPYMVNIPRDGDVLAGDTLVTSGYGGIYPKGLLVGHVTSLRQDEEGFVKNAVVQPSVNFNTLEEVLVIRRSREASPGQPSLEPKLVPQTQRDQVEGVRGANNP